MARSVDDPYTAVLLTEEDDSDTLSALRADSGIEFIDRVAELREAMAELRPPVDAGLSDEPARWAYFPWRRTVVGVLGPHAHRRLRLDRNRNLITAEEQLRLGRLRIGVIGLSVGHAVAHTLAAQGVCGGLRLADFDGLEVSNLNRVPASLVDVGINKAVVAARRIAELDPYLSVQVMTEGVTPATVEKFLDGLDVVVEECDSLDVKVLVREHARARRLPVLMATSDRGLLDIERFDLDPSRPLLHGLLGDIDSAALSGLTSKDKVPYVLRILDAAALSPRMAASLVEVGTSLTTWPQLAGEVALGATAITEAVRRIGLGEPLASGRVRIDAAALLDGVDDPLASPPVDITADETAPDHAAGSLAEEVAAAAVRAPSGGNAQPWHIESRRDAVYLWVAPEATTAMDVAYRGSAVALGAAVFNARVAAAAHHRLGGVDLERGDEGTPLRAVVHLGPGENPDLARLYPAMMRRETNRQHGSGTPIGADEVEALAAAAHAEGARLTMLTEPHDIARAAEILAATDRIRFLTPHLHSEMFSELRWPGDPAPDSGIDVRTLELGATDLVKLDILRRGEVMANLANWQAGAALGDDTYERLTSSAALGVVSVKGRTLTDYLRGGSATEAVWIAAEQHGVATHPVSPVFLYAHDERELAELSPAFARELGELQHRFRALTGTGADESEALVLRFSIASRPAMRSRRRRLSSAAPA
ncbi:Rv1355c family protein [Mycolicibacterium baixiangningiae]|uniref:Rv1355c family protein n=1 Tax=Mycolicibacterium baixiangningiae TaxID=2761578 RepID=UPI001865B560|nr:Rv1355c family protein [Mycolicibacterium baixiangningiae]